METGLDVFLDRSISKFKDANIGLVTNSTGINRELRMNIDLFLEKGLKVTKLFGPEHGVFGAAPDGAKVTDFIDPRYKIPVYSLYGDNLRPTKEMLEGIDVMIYDIQDVGLRFYTYIYTMAYCMEECAKYGIKFVVLDRPNPLCAEIVEGPTIKKDFESFVGGYGLALRYGLTIGELALYLNNEYNMGVNLTVIPMRNYKRSFFYDETELLWNTPSPNLPSLEHTILYIGMCLFEGVNVSVGRGTVHPFRYIGAPWIDSKKLYEELKKFNHQGVTFRERIFVPAAFKLQNQVCNGLEFFVTDKKKIKPLDLAIDVIATLRKIHSESFQWNDYFHDQSPRYYFDLLIGSDYYRKAIEEGATSKDFESIWQEESEEFLKISKKYWLY
ncbi:exo-beta-N-acetylmuramidase NamZ family protein [Thermotoga profunda]|uniref:exo-beta-N-acetylmuramidase NamZ family protein n=1 Tax=Thermotoga profunda TaxID=1508420 RepID=UPI0005976B9A|nr:DUF1343 domain-containing protein [Thermotoga profunda]